MNLRLLHNVKTFFVADLCACVQLNLISAEAYHSIDFEANDAEWIHSLFRTDLEPQIMAVGATHYVIVSGSELTHPTKALRHLRCGGGRFWRRVRGRL